MLKRLSPLFRKSLYVLVLLLAAGNARAEPTWLVLGDSLSAAYGIPVTKGWVALLQDRLHTRGYSARVVNASVSGETTAGGLARLPALLQRHAPDVVLIELGGNDGLRALPVARLRENLTRMARLSRDAGAVPVIFQMHIPENYGEAYTKPFAESFTRVAKKEDVPLAPFILAPIAGKPEAFQADGIHPRVEVQGMMLETVWPVLEKIAKQSR